MQALSARDTLDHSKLLEELRRVKADLLTCTEKLEGVWVLRVPLA